MGLDAPGIHRPVLLGVAKRLEGSRCGAMMIPMKITACHGNVCGSLLMQLFSCACASQIVNIVNLVLQAHRAL